MFISWSKDRSRQIALIWKSLIEDTFDAVDAFVSDRDISPGERGLTTIKEQLDGTSVGIPIVTRDNEKEPWINFESGALSKGVPNAPVRVMPCLVDFNNPSELTSPLTQFQAKLLNKEGVSAILATIAEANSIDWQRKQAGFEARWPEFEALFDAHRAPLEPVTEQGPVRRTDSDMLSEIVNNTRELRKALIGVSHSHEEPSRAETAVGLLELLQAEIDRGEDYGSLNAEAVMTPKGDFRIVVHHGAEEHREQLLRMSDVFRARIIVAAPLTPKKNAKPTGGDIGSGKMGGLGPHKLGRDT
ncbi:hypothetical protein MSTE_01746 [Mycobacteroides stephanolepidis]|uniref:TIR domain-containing protein n=1 Tax=[Mycobacterium] stephanolepidis TaxID=1520670 RepID=A0A1Z4EVT0_9MYCO|nr:hypothetical protein MSTE_01746 [[Mycobacterium] stephanolepidis]